MSKYLVITNEAIDRTSSNSHQRDKKLSFFKPFIQPKLSINQPNDEYEQEADAVADKVMRMSVNENTSGLFFKPVTAPIQRKCAHCEEEERQQLQRKEMNNQAVTAGSKLDTYVEGLSGTGQRLPKEVRSFFEPRMGYDFSNVKVHTDAAAAKSAQSINALAYTVGNNIVFNNEQYAPDTDSGKRLLGHELTHVTHQNSAGRINKQSAIQRDVDTKQSTQPNLTGPLTEAEWQGINVWLSYGEVGIDALTEDPEHNALVVADAIFCSRLLFSSGPYNEDPLLCVVSDVTRSDPRVIQVAAQVNSRGPIINWSSVSANQRILHVMNLLVDQYHYPVNGAAGLVGNLLAESGVLPNRIEGSASATPMQAPDFHGHSTQFTATDVMNRDTHTQQGPRLPGIGLAQWTSPARRTGLFQHQFNGTAGAAILFNMDAQVDYLVNELQNNFPGVNGVLTRGGVSVNDASDEVVYSFETPGSVIDGAGHRLPRTDPGVQATFGVRRANAQRALRVYQEAHR